MGIISAVLLYVLVSIFARGAENEARFKILGTAMLAAVVQSLIARAFPSLVGLLSSIAMAVAVVAILLILWCEIERKVALKIAAIYMGTLVAIGIFLGILLRTA